MQASTSGTMQHLWLTLLMVSAFCVGMSNQGYRAERQQQQPGLASGLVPNSPDDEPASGSMPGLFVQEFLSLSPSSGEVLSIVGSGAYPGLSFTVHRLATTSFDHLRSL
jgi:hypothetical protein